MGDFTAVPLLDYDLIVRGERVLFLKQLRYAFVNVGFCYLKNTPVDKSVMKELVELTPKFFNLPQDKKDKISMINSPHFLGYNKLGSELTRGAVDQREQCDFGTPYYLEWKEGDPDYIRNWGNCQWPDEEDLPGFRSTLSTYQNQLAALSFDFLRLLAESLYIAPRELNKYFEPKLQHRSKLVKYPEADPAKGDQGVGAHFDAGFLTFLLQVSSQPGLQIQNLKGEWIDAPPIPDTLVVNIGKGFEVATKGVARATSHRVHSPLPGTEPRYSIPFFQSISQTVRVCEVPLYEKGLPQEIEEMVNARGSIGPTDSVNFSEYDKVESGLAWLVGRIKSHPNVGKRYYPERYKEIFGDAEPAIGAYA